MNLLKCCLVVAVPIVLLSPVYIGGAGPEADNPLNVVSLYTGDYTHDERGDCSGMLLTDTFVITSRHCLYSSMPELTKVYRWRLVFYDSDRSYHLVQSGPTVKAKNIYLAPDGEDVALVELHRSYWSGLDLGYFRKIYPGTNESLGGKTLECWGSGGSSELGKAKVRVSSSGITTLHVEVEEGKGVRHGDSGGPCFYYVGDEALLAGIIFMADVYDGDDAWIVGPEFIRDWVERFFFRRLVSSYLKTGGSYNNDVKDDWMFFAPWRGEFVVMLSNGNGTFSVRFVDLTQGSNYFTVDEFFTTADFNGDGLTDWLWSGIWTTNYTVVLSNGDGTFTTKEHNIGSQNFYFTSSYFFNTGDYDGDRKTDWSLFSPSPNGNDFVVGLSNGDGTFTVMHNITGWGNWSNGKFFTAADYNGDGKTDWSWYAPWSDDYIVMLSNGDGTFTSRHNNVDTWWD